MVFFLTVLLEQKKYKLPIYIKFHHIFLQGFIKNIISGATSWFVNLGHRASLKKVILYVVTLSL